jgi:predicted metal-dependent hydrolase
MGRSRPGRGDQQQASREGHSERRRQLGPPDGRSVAVTLLELAPTTREALLQGRLLYEAGRFFEAHEAWEEAWLVERGDVRTLLQGLIQVAAGFVKGLRDVRPAGAVKLFEAALARLEPLPDGLAGVALDRFRAELGAAVAAARRWRDGESAGLDARPPRLDVR